VAGHHVDREIHQVDDLRIALADAGGFDDDQVIAETLQEADAVLEHGVGGDVLAARGHGAHEHTLRPERVHADAVAQQRAAAAATGRVHRRHGDAHLRVGLQEAVDQLVGDAGLAGTAGTGEADHRRVLSVVLPAATQCFQRLLVQLTVLDGAEHAADPDLVVLVRHAGLAEARVAEFGLAAVAGRSGATHHVLDHRHQAHVHAVVGVVDALDAVVVQLADLLRRDGATAAA